MSNIFEGGNVFKDADKNPLTQRIKREQIPSTIAYLEKDGLGSYFKDLRRA